MAKRLAKTHWKTGTFLLLLLLAIAGAVSLMPTEKVHAYVPPCHGNVARVGSLDVVIVYANGEPATKAAFSVATQWNEAAGETDTDRHLESRSSTSSLSSSGGSLTVPYVDGVGWGNYAFEFDAERQATITLTETTHPSDGYSNKGPITISYSYDNIEEPGNNTRSPYFDDEISYGLQISVSGDAALATEQTLYGYDYYGAPIYAPAKHTITITYTKDAGNLTVEKKLAGNDTDPTKTFDFMATFSDTNGPLAGKTFGSDQTDDQGQITFSLTGGSSKTITGIPDGASYTVSETPVDGYIPAKSGDAGTIVKGETQTATFTNTRNSYGKLTVAKALAGNNTNTNDEFSFEVALGDTTFAETCSGVTFAGGKGSFSLKGGESKTIEGLPHGATYTVTETDAKGYESAGTGARGTIDKDTPATCTFTNTKNAYGNLVVRKVATGANPDTVRSFDFTVTLSDTAINGTYGDMNFTNGVAEFSLANGGSVEAKDLPHGIGYTVTEASYADQGYTTTKENDTGTIPVNDTVTSTFTNTRQADGSLTIEKKIEGNDVDASDEFTFGVELNDTAIAGNYSGVAFSAGKAEIKLKGGESKTIEGLPHGVNYLVTETDARGYESSSSNARGTIDENTPAVATFTNVRESFGNLTITKKVSGNEADPSKPFDFVARFTDAYGNPLVETEFGIDLVDQDGQIAFSLKDGESKIITDIPNGVRYEIEELSSGEDGYNPVVWTEAAGGEVIGNPSGTIVGGTPEPSSVSFTATNTKESGNLKVEKVTEGHNKDKVAAFDIRVTLSDTTINGTYGDMNFENGVAKLSLAGGASATAEKLPVGVGYAVTEAGYSNEGYVTTYTNECGEIAAGQTATATVTNTREPDGTLTVAKIVEGNDVDASDEFTFEVALDEAIDGTYSDVAFAEGKATLTLKGGESKTIEGLPHGVGYTVTETDTKGYDSFHDGNTGTIHEDEPAVVEFENYRDTFGSLTVTKALAGNNADEGKAFDFTVTFTGVDDVPLEHWEFGQDVTDAAGKITFALKGGEHRTITGIPNGVGYTISEADYTGEGYGAVVWTDAEGRAVNGNPAGTIDGAAPDPSSVSFTATNTKNSFGNLEVKKAVAGHNADKVAEFAFTVTLDDEEINGTFGDMVFADGVAKFSLAGGESAVAEGLPLGTGYAVVEDDYSADGYVTDWENDKGVIHADQTVTAAFTNTREPDGTLTVSKHIEGNAASASDEFSFEVALDEAIDATFSDVAFSAGKATFKLKGGESKTIEGLPHGVGYTVTETDALGYNSTHSGNTGTIHEDEPAVVSFVNTKDTFGSITVTKALSGNAADADKPFEFTAAFTGVDDVVLAHHHFGSDVTDEAGHVVFSLKGGESKTITGIPNGTAYTISEADYSGDGYDAAVWTDAEGAAVNGRPSGAVTGGDPVPNVAFTATNAKNAHGNLEVKKITSGHNKDKVPAFDFTVTLDDETIAGEYGGMTFEGGVAKFSLAGDASLVAEGLPAGVGYTVSEADYAAEGYVTDVSNGTGVISADHTVVATFTNTREPDGALTVSKRIEGTAADVSDEFAFEIVLDDKGISGTYSGVAFTDGKATLKLKGGEAKTIAELPHDVAYTVSETDTLGYESKHSGNTGTIHEDEPAVVAFTNTKNKTPDPSPDPDPDPTPDPTPEPDPTPDPDPTPVIVDPEPVVIDPPLQKIVTGDNPTSPGTFTFLMKAVSNTAGYSVEEMPMPEGAANGVKRHTVQGPGSYEFGEYTVTKAGQYVYELSEENTAEKGYTYDTTRYTITWDIVEVDNKLVASKTITDNDGNAVEAAAFTNTYKKESATPSTPSSSSAKKSSSSPSTSRTSKTTAARTTATTARTGDAAPIALIVLVLAGAAGALGVAARKRDTNAS